MFETEANGNKSRVHDYYAGVLLGNQKEESHEGACQAYCGKEGFSYAAIKEHTTTDFDCFCGNSMGDACDSDNCIKVIFRLYLIVILGKRKNLSLLSKYVCVQREH